MHKHCLDSAWRYTYRIPRVRLTVPSWCGSILGAALCVQQFLLISSLSISKHVNTLLLRANYHTSAQSTLPHLCSEHVTTPLLSHLDAWGEVCGGKQIPAPIHEVLRHHSEWSRPLIHVPKFPEVSLIVATEPYNYDNSE